MISSFDPSQPAAKKTLPPEVVKQLGEARGRLFSEIASNCFTSTKIIAKVAILFVSCLNFSDLLNKGMELSDSRNSPLHERVRAVAESGSTCIFVAAIVALTILLVVIACTDIGITDVQKKQSRNTLDILNHKVSNILPKPLEIFATPLFSTLALTAIFAGTGGNPMPIQARESCMLPTSPLSPLIPLPYALTGLFIVGKLLIISQELAVNK